MAITDPAPQMQMSGAYDLELKKTGPDTCKNSQPCDFEATVTNIGTEPYVGPLVIIDAIPSGMTYQPPGGAVAPWTCGDPHPVNRIMKCDHPELTIAPGASAPALAIRGFRIDPASERAFFVNRATLELGAAHKDANPANDSGEATVKRWQLKDPGSLSITKTADDPSCAALERCGFTITVTNDGPGPRKGEIVVSDLIDAGVGGVVEFANRSSSWDCGAGVALPGKSWLCKLASTTLAKGSSVSLKVELVFPVNFSGQTVKNCAQIGASVHPFNEDLGPKRSCASVTITEAEPQMQMSGAFDLKLEKAIIECRPGIEADLQIKGELPLRGENHQCR